MALFVLDTDTLTLAFYGQPQITASVQAHLHEELAISVITASEILRGRMAQIDKASRPELIARTFHLFCQSVDLLAAWVKIDYTEAAIARFETLRRMKLNVGANDLRIASIVLEHNATLVTRNIRDFSRVPNLLYTNWAE